MLPGTGGIAEYDIRQKTTKVEGKNPQIKLSKLIVAEALANKKFIAL
jgi:hypothetical protein